MSIIDKILFLMNTDGMTARQLTADLGLAPSAISEWKKGKAKPSAEAIIKIADYFNVTTDYLLLDSIESPISKHGVNNNEPGLHSHLLKIDRMNELLKNKGISKAFIANKLGKHRALLNHWESGKSQPSQDDLAIIASVLGTTIEYLTGESDEKEAVHGEMPLSDKCKRLLKIAWDLPDEDLEKVVEYAEFVKSKRK